MVGKKLFAFYLVLGMTSSAQRLSGMDHVSLGAKAVAGAGLFFAANVLSVVGHELGHALIGKLTHGEEISINIGGYYTHEKPVFTLGGVRFYKPSYPSSFLWLGGKTYFNDDRAATVYSSAAGPIAGMLTSKVLLYCFECYAGGFHHLARVWYRFLLTKHLTNLMPCKAIGITDGGHIADELGLPIITSPRIQTIVMEWIPLAVALLPWVASYFSA